MGEWMIWRGILLGLGAAAPIGPVNVEIARRSLRGGFRSGFGVGAGAVTVDVTYALLLALGMQWLMAQPWMPAVKIGLGFAGAVLLACLGFGSLLSARRMMRTDVPVATEPPKHNYLTGLVMTATNPMTLAFWLIVVPAAAGGTALSQGWSLPLMCAGVFLGAMSWVLFFAGAMSGAGRLGKHGMLVLADILGGTILLGFAVYAIIGAWGVWRAAYAHL